MRYSSELEEEHRETLWKTLEEEHQIPGRGPLSQLSGLFEEDVERLARFWPEIPEEERQKLVKTLGHMAEHDFEMDFSAVFRLALEDTSGRVRAAAIDGLWESQDTRLIARLAHFLRHDPIEEVRAAAAQCLAHFILLGELQKIHERSFETAYQALHEAYHDPEETLEVRRRALESIAYVGRESVIAMIRAAYKHPDERMQLSAIFAMGRSADRRWKEIVVRHLHNPNPAMRYEAARATGELSIHEATPELIDLTEDVDNEVQQTAIWALGQVGGERARRVLEKFLEDESEALREAAKEALNEFEFLHGDLSRFYGPPEEFIGESNVSWEEEWTPWLSEGT
ncbi:MAG: HEAT repeat domain-containing protein [Anaerolineae bacterium]